jgi:hypothetical protein
VTLKTDPLGETILSIEIAALELDSRPESSAYRNLTRLGQEKRGLSQVNIRCRAKKSSSLMVMFNLTYVINTLIFLRGIIAIVKLLIVESQGFENLDFPLSKG